MVDRSLYAILSPEGFAAILHKDATKAPEIVDTMKILPEDLQALGIIDGILDTPRSVDAEEMARMARCLIEDLGDLSDLTEEERLERRYQRYRKFG
jgi:acetyl-CoA carboxylase carboxyl transferase subunit alpha